MNYKRLFYQLSICLFYLLAGWTKLTSQLPPYQVHNASNGLISNVVYDIHQDAQGYIWFATEAGLSRFDGSQFTNYTTDEGLPVNEVLDLKEDSKGRLWCMTFPGIPTYIEKGKIVHSRKNDWMRKVEVPIYYEGFLEDYEGLIWMVGLNGDVVRLNLEKKEAYKITSEEIGGQAMGIWEDRDHRIWLLGRDELFKWNGVRFESVNSISRYYTMVLKPQADGSALALGSGGVLRLVDGKYHEIISDSILSGLKPNDLFIDSREELWVSTNAGLLQYRLQDGKYAMVDHLLKDVFVSRLDQDQEGNYWVSSLGEGVYFFPSFDLVSLNPKGDLNSAFFCLASNSVGEVLAGGNRIWGKIKGKEFLGNWIEGLPENRSKVIQILLHPKGHIFLLSPGGLVRIFPDGSSSLHYVSCKRIGIGPESTVFLASKKEVFQFGIDEQLPLYFARDTSFFAEHSVFQKRPFDLAHAPDQRFLAIDNDSIYYFNGETFLPDRGALPAGSEFLRKIHFDHKGDMWLLMEGKGAAHLVDGKWYMINKETGLSSTLMFSISDGPDGSILLGTQKGLNQIHVEGPGKYQIKNYDKYDGLPSNVIYDALFLRDSIWVATPSGLIGFRLDQIPPHNYDPPIHFTSFHVNNMLVPLDSTLEFPHSQNHITVGFKGLSFRHGGQLRYRYRIVGEERGWSVTDFPQVEFPQLEPGDYMLEVQPIRRDGQPGEHTARLTFTINQPFWGTIWFRTLCAICFLLLVVLVFRIRVLTYNRDVVRELFEMAFPKNVPVGFLVVKSDGLTVRIPYPEIKYLEAQGDYVKIFTEKEVIMVHTTMKKLRAELPEKAFIRIHRSYMISLDKVRAAKGKTALMIDETELPIGRTYKDKVASALDKILDT